MNHRMLRRAAALITTFLVLPAVVVLGGSRPLSAAVPPAVEPQCNEPGPSHPVAGAPLDADVDYILELSAGEDPDHWAHFVLDKADVEPADQNARIIYTYVCAINGVWLRLTETEADAIDALTGARPAWAKSASRAFDVSIPFVDGSAIVDYTLASPQIEPAWLERLEWPGAEIINPLDPQVTVAIIDTGIDFFHADLAGTILGGYDCTHAYEDRWQYDPHGHGTHVWGHIGALDNDINVVGGAAGNAFAYAIPVLGPDGSGSSASVLCGIDQAMGFDVDYANLSLGGFSQPSECGQLDPSHNGFCTAVDSGMTIVVAAGNDTLDAYFQAPANYPEVITVAAIAAYPDGVRIPGCSVGTPDNTAATFTSWGPVVDVAAPGVCNPSTIPGNYTAWGSGTSMASPTAVAVFVQHQAECGPEDSVSEVLEWSESWTRIGSAGQYFWPYGPDQPPLMRFGAPCNSQEAS